MCYCLHTTVTNQISTVTATELLLITLNAIIDLTTISLIYTRLYKFQLTLYQYYIIYK